MNRAVRFLRKRASAIGALAATGLLALTLGTVPSASGAFTATTTDSTDIARTATYFHCQDALSADAGSALFQWPLSDASGSTTAADISGKNHSGTYPSAITTSTASPIACPRDGGSAWQSDGSTGFASYPTQQTNPTTFTIEIWFRTSVAGGKLIGFGTGTGTSGQYDRHLYIDKNGAVVLGVYANAIKTVKSAATGYADGSWHYAAGSLSSAGLSLTVDAAAPVTDPSVTTAENDTGYWKVGSDTLGGSWPNVATGAFTGSLRYAAVYSSALPATQIGAHRAAGIGS